MEPVLIAILPGVLGGLMVAVILYVLNRRGSESMATRDRDDSPRSDVINAARIRVAGVGGLGLLAMAATVAWQLPRIAQTSEIGAALGLVLAAILIIRRRSSGGLPSSGQRPGANTTLAIDQSDAAYRPEERATNEAARPRTRTLIGWLGASTG